MVKSIPSISLQWFAGIVLFAMLCVPLWAGDTKPKPVLEKAQQDTNRPILFDTDEMPPYMPQTAPLGGQMASLNSWTNPILDHTGKPHKHGHLIQIIADGGNGRQDPPNPDGTPGGDDSLAYGNFNMMRLTGLDDPPKDGATGMFFSKRYFAPFLGGRAYYLRLWEGDNIATAPYYQDTSEYDAGEDRGGAMLTMTQAHPIDVDWKFGPSKPRPQTQKTQK